MNPDHNYIDYWHKLTAAEAAWLRTFNASFKVEPLPLLPVSSTKLTYIEPGFKRVEDQNYIENMSNVLIFRRKVG